MDLAKLILTSTKDKAYLIDEVLMVLGALSITFSDEFDDEIFEPPVGQTPLWDNVVISALFDSSVDTKHIKKTLKDICNVDKCVFEVLQDRVWEDECKRDFKARSFGKNLWVCPSWENSLDLPKDSTIINMEPGLAFGTGSHQTTSLCLEYLDANPPKNLNVIDYGTGTGILAIACVKLGASKVLAIDNDPQAILATRDNSKNNNVDIDIFHSDDKVDINPADLLIANILSNPLIELSQHFASLVKENKTIILSGILDTQLDKVLQAYKKYFSNIKCKQQDQWCLISGIRTNTNTKINKN